MKKLLIVIACVLAAVNGVNAQGVNFGVRAGMNVANAGGDFKDEMKDVDFKSRVGFHVGVIADVELSEKFYLQPGLYFTTKGLKSEDKEGMGYEEKYNLNYLELPILASYRFNLSDNVQWQINAGPYFAVGVGGKVKGTDFDGIEYKYDAFGVADEDSDEEKGGLKRFDAGLSFGTGITYNKIYFGIKYDLGLANIADKKAWTGENDKGQKIRNRNFAISVGYTF
ncbi:porin family protein [uncultured Bacteroides sp.]|uniref:porin family protein n=1 Tax=uncultured Bacteroides sp. TaxID=162156 RepID=UPI0025F05119|nr:porin family protein [uncultured Bacteroides sp.]